jgi:hypothetical protein
VAVAASGPLTMPGFSTTTEISSMPPTTRATPTESPVMAMV